MNKKGDKVRRTKDDMDKVFVDAPTAEEYWKLLRDAIIRMHDMYDSYYKKDNEVKHDAG